MYIIKGRKKKSCLIVAFGVGHNYFENNNLLSPTAYKRTGAQFHEDIHFALKQF